MEPMAELTRINEDFQRLLVRSTPAALTPVHRADELMVWFMLGGKDVGKSTFLNALLHVTITDADREDAEGTRSFTAYLHRSQRDKLATRLTGLPVELRYHEHDSEAHRHLCLIDGPDFDSRFVRHAGQVRRVLEAGAADGAVLLTSPAKYKDEQYWQAFARLADALSPGHILFALTKADELGGYLDSVRADFTATIARRVKEGRNGAEPVAPVQTYLIDSPRRAGDFPKLEARLLRKLSAAEVRDAQRLNIRHALAHGVEEIRRHYRLDEVRRLLTGAAEPDRAEEIFTDFFPEAYFQTVSARLLHDRRIAGALRERIDERGGQLLAGTATLGALGRRLSRLVPFRGRAAGDETALSAEVFALDQRLRWGQEDLTARLAQAKAEVLHPLRRLEPEAAALIVEEPGPLKEDLSQLLDDHLAQPAVKRPARPLRLLLNLPVYMYLALFVIVLFFPVFLMLQAWGIFSAPDLQKILTLDNLKISVIGFLGYYIMALFFAARRQREWVRREAEKLVQGFTAELRNVLRRDVMRPLERFIAALDRLEKRLRKIVETGNE